MPAKDETKVGASILNSSVSFQVDCRYPIPQVFQYLETIILVTTTRA